MSLYAEYVKESVNWDTLEDDDSFITYEFQSIGPVRCMKIIETYVRPEARGKNKALELVAKVEEEAKRRECKYISAVISKNYSPESQERTAHICKKLGMEKQYEDIYHIIYRREVR